MFGTISEGLQAIRKQILARTIPDHAFYVPLNGKRSNSSEEPAFDLLEAVQQFLIFEKLTSEEKDGKLEAKESKAQDNLHRVLLLLGDAGSGKSLFCHDLVQRLWRGYEEGRPIPFLISLPLLSDPIAHAVEETLAGYGFTEAQIASLKKEQRFVFILDGYDELHKFKNLYVSNRLSEWQAKVIITCRNQVLYHIDDSMKYFVPFEGEKPQSGLLQQCYVAPFSEQQVEAYIKLYETQSGESKDLVKPQASYQQFLQMPGLKQLVTTPFLLRLVVEVLPDLLMKHEEKAGKDWCCTRVILYDLFVARWFKRQEDKLRASKHLDEKSPDMKPQFWQYCKDLALKMREQEVTYVTYNPLSDSSDLFGVMAGTNQSPWEPFFKRDPHLALIRSACPLQQFSNGIYGFFHASMIEYFATRAIYEEEISKSSVPMLRTPLFAENEHKEDMPQTLGYLHTKLFSQDFAVVSFLADRLAEGEVAQDQFKATLFQTLEKSKKEERYAIGAANAITILNYARTSFSAMDFNDVRIPGADVSYGIFDNTQFQRANLQNVTFTGAWLRQANFTTADMTGVKFGESPYIELSAKIITCTYSHSGDLLAVGCGDGNIYLYEVHSCKQICVFKENERGVRSVTFDPNDTYLASGSWDHKVRLWKVATRQLEHTFEGHIGIVTSVAFSPNGEYVVSGSEDKIICLWEIAGGNLKHKFIGHLEGVYSVSFDKQGKFVASGSSDKTICLWEVSTGKCKLIFKGHSGTINSVAFDPKGKYLVSGSADRTIRFWDVKEGCPVRVLEEHTAEIRRVAFDHKGDRLGCGRSDGVVEIRQLPGCKIERVLEGHTDLVFSVAFDPRSKCLVSTGSDSKLRLWQIEEKSLRQTVGGHVGEVNSVAFDLQGDNVASGGADKIIRIWEIKTGKLKCIFEGHTEDILSVIFNPQGKFLASGSIDKTVRLWEIETRKLKHVLLGHTKIVTSVVFSADGKYVVSGSLDEKICLWEVETGNLKYKLKDMWGGIECMAFDVQKGYLAAAGMVSQIFIWDIATGKLNYMLDSTHASIDIRTIAFDPLGEHLAAGSGKNNRNNIQLWEITGVKRSLGEHKVAAGRLKRTTFKGHTGTVLSIAFAPTGNYLASGSRDRTVRLWDVASGARLLVLHGFMGNVNSISWKQTAKDLLLITGSDDIAVRCWKIFEEEKGKLRAILQWTSHQVALTLKETCIEGVKGLDTANMKLCKQHGAVVEAIQQHGIFSRPPIITDAKKENQSRLTVTPVQIVKTSVSESPGKDKSRCLLM